MEIKKVRISKLMSEQGLASRREADKYIQRGIVYANGQQVTEVGTKVFSDTDIVIERPIYEPSKITILMNKPVGYVSGQPEKNYKPAITLINPRSRLTSHNNKRRFRRAHLVGLAVAGRLDIDSTGLLVFTQDGTLAKKLIGENTSVEKEYIVKFSGSLDELKIKKLNGHMSIDGFKLKPAVVTWPYKNQLNFILKQGKKRQIRKMCEQVGIKVLTLHRRRIGRISLGAMPSGNWRYLDKNEEF